MKRYDITWRKFILPPLHNEGWKFLGIFAAVSALLGVLVKPFGWVGAILTVWCFYFFRDPERITPEGEDLVISPADGTVQIVITSYSIHYTKLYEVKLTKFLTAACQRCFVKGLKDAM